MRPLIVAAIVEALILATLVWFFAVHIPHLEMPK